jgi:hypothetical protein
MNSRLRGSGLSGTYDRRSPTRSFPTTSAQTVAYIEHNEFGIAFEYLVGALVERKIPLAEQARASLSADPAEMGLEDNADWIALGR